MVEMAKSANIDNIKGQLRNIFGAVENLNDDWNVRRGQQQTSSGHLSRSSTSLPLDPPSAPARPSGEPPLCRKRAAPPGAQVAAKQDRPSELLVPKEP